LLPFPLDEVRVPWMSPSSIGAPFCLLLIWLQNVSKLGFPPCFLSLSLETNWNQ
jgi:hypothetical protein